MAATPAWAVGERVLLQDGASTWGEQLKETLCLSMECVTDSRHAVDAKVTAKVLKDKKGEHVEVRVLSAQGQVKASFKAPLRDGRVSAMDLVALTSATVGAIEAPERLREGSKPVTQKSRRSAHAGSRRAS